MEEAEVGARLMENFKDLQYWLETVSDLEKGKGDHLQVVFGAQLRKEGLT